MHEFTFEMYLSDRGKLTMVIAMYGDDRVQMNIIYGNWLEWLV